MKNTAQNIVRRVQPSTAALDSIITLRHYCVGKADGGSVNQALRHLEYIYGLPVKDAVARFRRGLGTRDKFAQHELVTEALSGIVDWIFRQPYKAAAWRDALQLGRLLKATLSDTILCLSILIEPEPVRSRHYPA